LPTDTIELEILRVRPPEGVAAKNVPLVFLHGAFAGAWCWAERFLPWFAMRGYTCLAPSFRGHGGSGGAARINQFGIADYQSDLASAIAGLNRPPVLVGHSMGTILCQYLASYDPALVRSLTLYGPILEPPVAGRQGLKERAKAARRDGMAGIADAVCQGSLSVASRSANPVTTAFVRESLMRQDPRGYAAHCEALAAMEPADHAAIHCPTCLVVGGADSVAPVAMGEVLQSRIKGARLEVLPDIGHWMMIEAPQRSTDLLRETLEASGS